MSKSEPRKSRADRARDIALYRYSLIRPLADPGLSPVERGRLVRKLAAQVHLGLSCGT
jgi:putative transposase